MGKYRTEVLLNFESINTAGTRIIDLEMTEPISRISLVAKGTNDGSTPTAHPAAMIQKIELVNGSDVLYSLSGYEAEALNILDYGYKLYKEINYVNDSMTIFTANLDFGRYLWDTDLALVPSDYENLQLRITHNKALGGCSPDAGTLSVYAHVFDEKKINPRGLIQRKEWKSETLAASSHFYTDLPVDLVMKKLVLFARYSGLNPFTLINKVKLTEDGGKRIVLNDVSVSDILKIEPGNPYFDETVREHAITSAKTNYCTPTYDTKIVWAPISGVSSVWNGSESYGGTYTSKVTAESDGDEIITGKAPHGAIAIPFGDQKDYTDWYDLPGKVKQLRLDITSSSSASSSHTYQIVCEQLRPRKM